MAVAVTHKTFGIGTGIPQSSGTITLTGGSGSRVLITVTVSNSAGADPGSTITTGWTGTGSPTFSELGSQYWGNRRRTWWFELEGATGTGEVTFSQGNTQEIGWVIDEATGLDDTTPSAGFTQNGSSGASSRTITTATSPGAGDATYSSVGIEDNIAITIEAGWTKTGETTTGSLGVRRVAAGWDSDADQSCAWTWGGSTVGEGAAIWILKAGSGGGGSSTPHFLCLLGVGK